MIKLEYPTHTLTLSEIPGTDYVKAINIVNGNTYRNMLDSIFAMILADLNFVEEERKLLNNYLKSLVAFHNTKENLLLGYPEMYIFSDETEYLIFSLTNDIPFNDNEWFNVVIIKTSLLNAITLFKDASVKLLKALYPQHYVKPEDLIAKAIRKYERKAASVRENYEQIVKYLETNGIDRLYHFTSTRNIGSIKKNGICSVTELIKNGIDVKYSSSSFSRELDNRNHLQDFVHLSYEHHHPMLFVALAEGRLYDYRIIQVSIDVILLKDTKFSDMNAAKRSATISDNVNLLYSLPFKNFHNKDYRLLSQANKDFFQAEVLVKNKVEPNKILNLNEL